MKPEIRVNRKFVILFVTLQILLAGVILYALVSPKSVTVHVEKVDRSFTVPRPLTITPPVVK